MKPSSSTTTSAHTDIGEHRSYFFASEGLELDIVEEKGERVAAPDLECLVSLDGDYTQLSILSTSIDVTGRKIVSLKTSDRSQRLLQAFIVNEKLDVVIVGLEFKALVVGVESDRSYLTILEQEDAGI
jgi:hypothetical protein